MPALAAALASQGVLLAEIKPNPLFTDGAVLQSGQSVPVWGTARDGEKVTVEIGEQKVSTTATNGLWRVNLKPLTAGGPFTMTLTGAQDNLTWNGHSRERPMPIKKSHSRTTRKSACSR